MLVVAAALVISACGDEDELSKSHPGRRVRGFPLRFFVALLDEGVVGQMLYPVALDARGRRVR